VHAREKLGEREWLRQIVIAAPAESSYPFVQARESAEDQHRCRLTKPPDCVKDRQSVDIAREHPVEDDHIPALAGRQVQSVDALAAPHHRNPRRFEAITNVAGGIGVVLDQKTLHARLLPDKKYTGFAPERLPATLPHRKRLAAAAAASSC